MTTMSSSASSEPQDTYLTPRMRLRFTRGKRFIGLTQKAYVSEVMEAIRRAEVPVAMGSGTPPRPRLTTGLSLPMGYTSQCEYVDVELLPPNAMPPMTTATFVGRLRDCLPEDIELRSARRIPPRTPHIRGSVCDVCYTIRGIFDPARAAAFRTCASWLVEQERKGKTRKLDLKQCVLGLEIHSETLRIKLAVRPTGTPKPEEILMSVFATPKAALGGYSIERTAMRLAPAPYPQTLIREL